MIKSYYQRLFSAPEPYIGEYDPVFEVLSEENYVDNGRCLKRKVVRTVDNREVMSAYSPDDFRIENLVAVGADKDARRYQYTPSTLEMMDSVNTAGEILLDIAEAVNNNEEKVEA